MPRLTGKRLLRTLNGPRKLNEARRYDPLDDRALLGGLKEIQKRLRQVSEFAQDWDGRCADEHTRLDDLAAQDNTGTGRSNVIYKRADWVEDAASLLEDLESEIDVALGTVRDAISTASNIPKI